MESYFQVYGEGLLLGIEHSFEKAQNLLQERFQTGIQVMIKGNSRISHPVQIFNDYSIVFRNLETGEKIQSWEYFPNYETEILSLRSKSPSPI